MEVPGLVMDFSPTYPLLHKWSIVLGRLKYFGNNLSKTLAVGYLDYISLGVSNKVNSFRVLHAAWGSADPTGPQTVALDFDVWSWFLSTFAWELLDFDVLLQSVDFGVEEKHKLASGFLPEALFEALILSSTQSDNSISSIPVAGELIVMKL